MRRAITALSLLAMVSCAATPAVVKPKRNSLLPVKNDISALLPEVKEPAVDLASLPKFGSISVDDNAQVCYPPKPTETTATCEEIPAGILVSERTYVEGTIAASEAKRFKVETVTLRKLRESEWAAIRKTEEAYQDTVAELQTEILKLEQRSWLERNAFPLGLVLGAATTVALTFAVSEAVQ